MTDRPVERADAAEGTPTVSELMAERDRLMEERDALMRARDRLLHAVDSMTAERASEADQRNALMVQRDALMVQRDEAMRQRDDAMRQRDEAVAARDDAMCQRDGVVIARDEAMRHRDEAALARDEVMRQRDRLAEAKHQLERHNATLVRAASDRLESGNAFNDKDKNEWLARGPYVRQIDLPGRAGSFQPGIRALGAKALLLTTFPKSGSTHLQQVLGYLTGFRHAGVRFDAGFNGLRFEDVAAEMMLGSYITKYHQPATLEIGHVLSLFDVRPIVLVRSLPDALLSLAEDPQFDQVEFGRMRPFGYVSPDFGKLSVADRLNIAVNAYAPWYIGFYHSWLDTIERAQPPAIYKRYEEITGPDAVRHIGDILDHLGESRSSPEIANALDAIGRGKHTRFNRGTIGRGKDSLTPSQWAHLKSLLRILGGDPLGHLGIE